MNCAGRIKKTGNSIHGARSARNHDAIASIHDTECQIISFHGTNAHGKGIIKQQNSKIYEKKLSLL
jgi:hypothetical protein